MAYQEIYEEIKEELNANWDFIGVIACYTNNTKTECFVVSRCDRKDGDETVYIVNDKNGQFLGISKNLDEASAYAQEMSENTSTKHRSSPNWWWS